jgi:nucleoside-diphosphate-sugar epimerase
MAIRRPCVHEIDSFRRAPVIVTGGAGYVGSVLVHRLLEQGQPVRVLDNFLFGDASLADLSGHPGLSVVRGDVRERAVLDGAFAGARAVVHLAGLVGDPLCALDPELTRSINEHSSVPVAEASRAAGVPHLVFASTCSVYGAAGDDWLDESSRTSPVSLYAETNLVSEEILAGHLSGSGTALTVLRFATIYGVSPRMRFDLVVNLLTARARSAGRLEVHGGDQWRPQVHVADVAAAVALVLERPAEAAGTFNVGSDAQNYRIRDLAQAIAAAFPGTDLTVQDIRDPRSYRVSFDRLRALGFQPAHDLTSGVREIADYLAREGVDANEARFHNVRALNGHAA